MLKKCIICNQEFEARDSRTVCCKNSECRHKYNKIKYAAHTKECVCLKCGKIYQATQKQRHDCCPNCIHTEAYKYKNQVEQKHCCRQCRKVMFTEIKNVTKNIPEYVYDRTCDDCKHENALNSSKRMILANPSYNNISYESIESAKLERERIRASKKKYHSKEEMYKAFSERMKLNNPMFNAEIKRKAHDTLKKRIKEGSIVYNWKNSQYYKGTRGIKNYIRLSLVW